MLSQKPVVCPPSLLQKALRGPAVKTAVVNATSQLVLKSAMQATQKGLIEPVLVGDQHGVSRLAHQLDWDVSKFLIVDASDEITAAQNAVALARGNEVQALMKGDVHTDTLLREVLHNDTGIRTDKRLSHVFHMTVPDSDQSLCITDAVVNVQPNVTTKIDIARNATGLLHALGNKEPKIAALSATEIPSDAMLSSREAEEIVAAAERGEIPGALVGGPFAFDNAISPEAARLKKVSHPVAGHADVLLVPNIETGNALFKQMVYFMSAAAAGVVLGATVPIMLTSRADPAAARLASAALAAIYAQHQNAA